MGGVGVVEGYPRGPRLFMDSIKVGVVRRCGLDTCACVSCDLLGSVICEN